MSETRELVCSSTSGGGHDVIWPPARHVQTCCATRSIGCALGKRMPPATDRTAAVAGGWQSSPNEASVRTWKPDHDAIGELAKRSTIALGLCVFARCVGDRNYQLVVRAFPAGVGIVEDPASGAANGLIAAWIALREPEGRARARLSRESRTRDGTRRVDFACTSTLIGTVWVGGRTHTDHRPHAYLGLIELASIKPASLLWSAPDRPTFHAEIDFVVADMQRWRERDYVLVVTADVEHESGFLAVVFQLRQRARCRTFCRAVSCSA